MNERIEELAEQAYRLTVVASHSELHKCVIGSDYFNALEKEKFAELIVKECGNYLNSPEFIGRSDLDWAMVLNEHFGVDE